MTEQAELAARLQSDANALEARVRELPTREPYVTPTVELTSGKRILRVTRRDGALDFQLWSLDEWNRAFPIPKSSVSVRAGGLIPLARLLAEMLTVSHERVEAKHAQEARWRAAHVDACADAESEAATVAGAQRT
jgi:hypothetical protein